MGISKTPVGYVLHDSAHHYEGAGVGWLSLKWFEGGTALYAVGARRYLVDAQHYLLLNHGQTYRVQVAANGVYRPTAPVRALCVFFAPHLAAQVAASVQWSALRLLDQPVPATPFDFFERTYPRDAALMPHMQRLATLPYFSTIQLEEQLHDLMWRVLAQHSYIQHEAQRLSAARPSTRAELYRRAHYARDYAAAMYAQDVTLEQLASVACLSPNHLLRVFKEVFQQTPHQYLTELRLAHAKRLLRETDTPILQVCYAVGFSSLGAFGTLFQRRVGLSPRVYRQQNR
jgi:AraC family transcriptional regulator